MDSETTSAEARLRDIVRGALDRAVAAIEPVEAGLGARRFFRVRLAGPGEPRCVIARMDAEEDPSLRPPGIPPEPPLEPIRALLSRHGLPVPACHAAGEHWMLLEDVGDTSLEQAAGHLPAAAVEALYEQACALVPRLQAVPPAPGLPTFERRLDEALFDYKAEQVIRWTLPWARARARASDDEAAAVRNGFRAIAAVSREAPQRLAHRDFKAANLHLHPASGAQPRLVMIDLQGAFLAPPEYDLVCLLRDSHVALEEHFVLAAREAVRPRLPDAPAPDAFARRFDLLTLTRNGKDLSRYLYAARARGDERYLRLVPHAVRTWKAAARRLLGDSDPQIRTLASLIDSLPETPCAG